MQTIKQGTIYVWGNNESQYGQCAAHDHEHISPTQISASATIVQIACGDEHTIFLTGTK